MQIGHAVCRARLLMAVALLLLASGLASPRTAQAAEPTFLREWDIPADPWWGPGFTPTIAIDDNDTVYVADHSNHVLKFTSTGTLQQTWGGWEPSSAPGEFSLPRAITVGPSGDVYVADNSFRVQRLTSDGVFVSQLVAPGSGDGEFDSIRGLVCDAAENLYVGEYFSNFRIQKFDSSWGFLAGWGSGMPEAASFGGYGLTFGPSGDLFVCDFFNMRVQRFTPAGAFVDAWDTLERPRAAVTASNGHLFVTAFDTIMEYTEDGTLIDSWAASDLGAGQIDGWGLAIDSADNLYMTDGPNFRVVVFSTEDTPAVEPPPAAVVSTPAGAPWSIALIAAMGLASLVLTRRVGRA